MRIYTLTLNPAYDVHVHPDHFGIENPLVSMGTQGAPLITGEQNFYAKPPHVQAVSTIGADDSAIAVFLTATVRGENNEGRLAVAVAFGTAASLTEGT